MKKYIILLTILTQIAYSQNLSEKVLKIEYNEYRIFTKAIVNVDLGTLLVSNDYSYYSSQFQKKIKNGKIDESESIQVNDEVEVFSEIIIDRKKNVLTEKLFEERFLKKKYAVFEDLPKMKWKLYNEKRKIGNYDCKKATTLFRGREYIVWYTEKIPISLGPWKFNGLPGLILAAEDISGMYKWEAKLISYPNNNSLKIINERIKEDRKYEKISFEEFDKKKIKKIKEKIEIVKSRNNGRNLNISFEYSTEEEREPINEFRNEKYFN